MASDDVRGYMGAERQTGVCGHIHRTVLAANACPVMGPYGCAVREVYRGETVETARRRIEDEWDAEEA